MSSQEGTELALKLELLATVAHATITAILQVVDDRRSGLLTTNEQEKVGNLRTQIESAVGAVEDYMERNGDDAIDLSGLRDKLVSIVETIDTRTTDVDALPS
jgi:hypothetical protein